MTAAVVEFEYVVLTGLDFWPRGTVLNALALGTDANIQRLLRLGTIRQATADEVGQKQVTLPRHDRPNPHSLESLLAQKDREIEVLKAELRQVQGDLAVIRAGAPPTMASDSPHVQTLMGEKDKRIRDLESQVKNLEQRRK